jgi:hypothetical protein
MPRIHECWSVAGVERSRFCDCREVAVRQPVTRFGITHRDAAMQYYSSVYPARTLAAPMRSLDEAAAVHSAAAWWPLGARAQQAKRIFRIGHIDPRAARIYSQRFNRGFVSSVTLKVRMFSLSDAMRKAGQSAFLNSRRNSSDLGRMSSLPLVHRRHARQQRRRALFRSYSSAVVTWSS